MSQDFIPRSEAVFAIWLNNFKTNIVIQGPILGLTPAEIAALVASCNAITASVNLVELKRTALNEAVTAKNLLKNEEVKAIRTAVAGLKTKAGYTLAIGESLSVVGTSTDLDTAAYKPEISAENFAGFVRIKFTKNGVDGVNISHRKKGEGIWHFLARDTKSPYDDHIVLEKQGQPEHWEYRAYGVIDDAEIGQPSDIVEIVFGG